MFRFGLKLGLAGGAVYYVTEQGLWKSSEDSINLRNKISEHVSPYTKEITKHIPYELPNLPTTNEVSYLAQYYWNKGVMASFRFLADLPSNVSYWTNQGIKSITESKEFKNMLSSDGSTEKSKEAAQENKS